MPVRIIVLLLLLFKVSFAFSQSLSDYEIQVEKEFQQKVFYEPKNSQWLEGEHYLMYYVNTPNGIKYKSYDVNTKEHEEAFDWQRLLKVINSSTGQKFTDENFNYEDLRLTGKKEVALRVRDSLYYFNTKDYRLSKKKSARGLQRWRGFSAVNKPKNLSFEEGIISPDKKYTAYIRDFNIVISPLQDKNKIIQLSFEGNPGEFYSHSDLKWSPDSKKIFAKRVKPGHERKIQITESSPTDQLQPKYHPITYSKPGDALPQVTPVIFSVENKNQLIANGVTLSNQYSLSAFEWDEESQYVSFEYNPRGHQKYQIIEMNVKNGGLRVALEENVETFFIYNGIYGKKFRHDIKDKNEIIWLSERDGWNHLYLMDRLNGKVKNQITKGNWVVRKVIHVDEEKRTILFTASGYDKNIDPYFLQVFKVNFDGTGLTQLTKENANHQTSFSSDYRYFIDTYSRIDTEPISVLRETESGKIIRELEKVNIDNLRAEGWKFPESFKAKGRDDETDIWGIIVRPYNFDPDKKYPVIEYIYAGPHDSFVPKSFTPNPRVGMVGLANLGFIVVQIDGMGTSNRSKKFHDVAYKNLKDGGFPDRIKWIKKAAEKYPYMDTNRVGIYGYSAGGQESSAALLFFPDFYKVAVSTSGNHDNRIDKLWWNEQFMGYPIGEQYTENSNTENAGRLEGDLMLQVGEMDTNVDPSSTYQFVDALIKHKKSFEFVLLTGENHHAGGEYGEMKRREFFVRKLLKNE